MPRNYVFKPDEEFDVPKKAKVLGKDADGKFRTAKANQYTSSLNLASAKATKDNLDHQGSEAPSRMDRR